MGAHELSTLLWHERELLEVLLFKLEEEQLLLTAGKTRWLRHATNEVEQVVERIKTAGLSRAVEASAVATAWSLPADAGLREIAAGAPSGPWGEIFRSHLAAMTDLATQIKHVRDANAQFLSSAARSTQETIATAGLERGVYDHRGLAASGHAGSRLFDTTL